MKYLILITTCVSILSIGLNGQNHQEIESPTSDVLSLNSTGSSSTVVNFLNSNAAPTGGSNKRAYISTNGNALTFGLSNNNSGGSMQWFSDQATRMTMKADGRLGLGIVPTTSSSLFQVEGESPDIATIAKKSGSSTDGSVLRLENNSTGTFNNLGLYAIVNGDAPAGGSNFNIAVNGWVSGTGERLIGVQGQAPQEGLAGRFLGRTETTLSHKIGEHPGGITPEDGTIQFNSATQDFEGYNDNSWSPLFSSKIFARILPNGNYSVFSGFGPFNIDFNLVDFNIGGIFNPSVGQYVAPTDGIYEINLYLNVEMASPTETEVRILVSGSVVRNYFIYDSQCHSFSTILELSKDDRILIEIEKPSPSVSVTVIGSGGSISPNSSALEIKRIN